MLGAIIDSYGTTTSGLGTPSGHRSFGPFNLSQQRPKVTKNEQASCCVPTTGRDIATNANCTLH